MRRSRPRCTIARGMRAKTGRIQKASSLIYFFPVLPLASCLIGVEFVKPSCLMPRLLRTLFDIRICRRKKPVDRGILLRRMAHKRR